MRASIATTLDVSTMQRWAAVVTLLATLALEIVDVLRDWPDPVPMGDCVDLCALAGTSVAAWTRDGCTCAGAP